MVRSSSGPPQPCSAPIMSSTRPGTPAEVIASASLIAWLNGTSGSLVPWKVRTGASSLETNVSGDALAAASGFSCGRATQEILDPGLADLGDVLGGQVGRTEVIDDGLDPAVGSTGGDVAFQAVARAGEPEHKGQMAARRKADRADPIGVDLVFLGVRLEPAHRGLHVVNLRGKRVLGTKPILGRDRDVTAADELGAGSAARRPCFPVARPRRGSRRPPEAVPSPPAGSSRSSLSSDRADLGVDDVLLLLGFRRLVRTGRPCRRSRDQNDQAQRADHSPHHETVLRTESELMSNHR